jgi:hypothetical protein
MQIQGKLTDGTVWSAAASGSISRERSSCSDGEHKAMNPQQTTSEPLPARDGSHIDELYAMFVIARDSFIKTRWPKPKPFLHNPLWHLNSTYGQDLDNALAEYATKWWATFGYSLTLNRTDGSFVVCENETSPSTGATE